MAPPLAQRVPGPRPTGVRLPLWVPLYISHLAAIASIIEVKVSAAGLRITPIVETMPLAVLADPFDHPDWIFEVKLDGFRALASTPAAAA